MSADYTFEEKYWGTCCNTYDEETKHYVYAEHMGIPCWHYSLDAQGARVLDIGGGPVSMLLKCQNLGKSAVLDPLHYPDWVYERYAEVGIRALVDMGEHALTFLAPGTFDEVWIYNCLQHTEDPEKIIKNALALAPTLRLFEWIDIPPHDGHPIMLTEELLNEWIGSEGKTKQLNDRGCVGRSYYNVHRI